MRDLRIGLLTLGLLVPFARAARAGFPGVPDHFKCHKTKKDTAGKATYTADLLNAPLDVSQSGCTIKVPAKLLCNGVDKTNVVPTPPGSTPNGFQFMGQLFVCYKLKCAKTGGERTVADQFGSRLFTYKNAKLVCAPATGGTPAPA